MALALVAKGLPNWEIAPSLKPEIGEETVKAHLASIHKNWVSIAGLKQ